MTMKLKLDDQGHAAVQDGKPIYVHDDGKEIPFDVVGTVATIGRLNNEAKTNRERAETAEAQLKTFDGIDPAKGRKALEIVENLDQKKLVDAGEKDKAILEAIKAVEEKYVPVVNEVATLKAQLYGEKIGGSFARSKYISEKVAIPSDLVQSKFGGNYKVEGGSTVAYDFSGNKVYSRARPGELADFEESIEILIDQYPHKDSILKGSGASGSGAVHSPSASVASGVGPGIKLSPVERMNAARAQRK